MNGPMPGPVLSSGTDMVLKFATDGNYLVQTQYLGFEAIYNKTIINILENTNTSISNSSGNIYHSLLIYLFIFLVVENLKLFSLS